MPTKFIFLGDPILGGWLACTCTNSNDCYATILLWLNGEIPATVCPGCCAIPHCGSYCTQVSWGFC